MYVLKICRFKEKFKKNNKIKNFEQNLLIIQFLSELNKKVPSLFLKAFLILSIIYSELIFFAYSSFYHNSLFFLLYISFKKKLNQTKIFILLLNEFFILFLNFILISIKKFQILKNKKILFQWS